MEVWHSIGELCIRIISLYKGQKPHIACSNRHPISLLSVTSKVFAHLLPVHMDYNQRSGITNGRSTIDVILALHLLSELHREFSQPLHVTYIDKSAFDSAHRLLILLSERTPLERCCVHNMSPFISSSGLSPGSREAKVQRAKVCLNCTEPSVARSSCWSLPVWQYLSDTRCKNSMVVLAW